MEFVAVSGGFDLRLKGRTLLSHRPDAPCLFVGQGEADINMKRGAFAIEDYVVARIALDRVEIFDARVRLSAGTGHAVTLTITGGEDSAHVAFDCDARDVNRLWIRLTAEADEHVWGGGEQFSYFNLRNRRYPMWTGEPGVGRDKTTLVTFEADRQGHRGGDYYTTYYPQPTFLTSRRTAFHLDSTAYSVLDFRHAAFHEIEVWAVPEKIEFWARDSFRDLVTAMADRFGRQPPLPDWVMQGAIVGLKDGDNSFARLETCLTAGTAVSGLWCEDWAGVRETSFGRRLFWDWRWNPQRFPDLPGRIAGLAAKGIRFLAYVNPYLCVDGVLYPEAEKQGYVVRRADDTPYVIDFGEFDAGMIDLTNPDAVAWFEEAIIGRNMLDLGVSGWMADFGEYLPVDAKLHSGRDGTLAHNAWPTLWGAANAGGVAKRNRTGDAVFFMRSGGTGVQAHCPLLWAGDQCVDFSRHDGLQTVICAALSSGLLGNAYHHADIGGYTSLFGNVRTVELIQRWAEMGAFTAVMRTHEGNRPDDNLQIDSDPEILAHFARMTRIYRHLAPYLKTLTAEAVASGLPVQRPLFLHFEDDRRTYDIQTEYLYGPDLLVAPVIEAGKDRWSAYLPEGATWVHVWSGRGFAGGGTVEVAAPIGQPPVFYREGATDTALFAGLAKL